MRVPSLLVVTLAPLFVSLIAPAALAASPAGKPVKRVAKRADAPYVLPAPSPKSEPLPPLPPPPPSSASALAPAIVAPFPPPAPPAAPAPLARPVVTASAPAPPEVDRASADPHAVKPTGFVLQLGSGVVAPASPFARGLRTFSPGVGFDFRFGGYASQHVGLLVGFRGSYGHSGSDCGRGCGKGYSLQVPVLLQLAQDRTRGLYGEVGLGLGTKFGAADDDAKYSISSPLEFKLGMGYRLAGPNGTRRSATLDMNLGLDIGTMNHMEVTTAGKKLEGSLDDAKTHTVVAFSLIAHFAL